MKHELPFNKYKHFCREGSDRKLFKKEI